jgi:hypothetical protein
MSRNALDALIKQKQEEHTNSLDLKVKSPLSGKEL